MRGLAKFKEYFGEYRENYILSGEPAFVRGRLRNVGQGPDRSGTDQPDGELLVLSAAAGKQGGEMNNERPDSPSGRFFV